MFKQAASKVTAPIARAVQGRFGRLIMIGAWSLTLVSWIVVAIVLMTADLTMTQKSLTITPAALVTEATFWISAAYFGVSVFQKIKQWRQNRRGKTDPA
jgi:hypothetical protein